MSSPMQVDTSGYLPPFLLGDNHSPSRQIRSVGGRASIGPMPVTRTLPQGLTHDNDSMSQVHRSSTADQQPQLQKAEKPGGPPVVGLFDNPANPAVKASTPLFSSRSPERRQLNFSGISASRPSTAVVVTPSHGMTQGTPIATVLPDSWGMVPTSVQRTPPSPAQMDPFYTQGEALTSVDHLDDHWITVFGFPVEARSFIVEQFAQYGSILKHIMANGNYVHICYQSKLQARTALSKNGKIFDNGIMIGVKQCIDKAVMNSVIVQDNPAPSHFTASLPQKSSSAPASMRPLTAAYQASSCAHEVQPTAANTPQRNNSLFSKAVEYIFGW